MPETICKECSKSFKIKRYLLKETGNFCSVACRKTGENVACHTCGKFFYRRKCLLEKGNNYCSLECCQSQTLFKEGLKPWNKNLKGIHLSPQSEFKKGMKSLKRVPIGTTKIRFRTRDGKERTYIKVAEPNKWMMRSQVVWIAQNGSIPQGSVIHHKDRNTLNDLLDNLQCLTRKEHIAEHRHEWA